MKAPFPLIGLSLLLLSLNAYSQSDRVPGYIVVNNGDTVRGFVIDRKDNWAVQSIEFASSESETPRSYPIGELACIYLKSYDAYYFGREVNIDKKPIDMNHLEDNGARRIVKETILLHLLVKGAINLYRYNDETGKVHFFAQKGENKLEELPYVRYMAANRRLADLHFYQGTLKNMASDCNKTTTPPSDYDEEPLAEFVKRYNSCFGQKNQYAVEQTKTKVAFGVSVGISSVSGNFTGQASGSAAVTGKALGKYSSVLGLFAGISAELRAGRRSNPSRAGLQLFWQKFPTTTRNVKSSLSSEKYEMDFSLVQLGPTYKYIFMYGKKVRPYLKAQVGAGLYMSANAIRTRTDEFGKTTVEPFAELNKINYSYGAGAGAYIYERVLIDISYKSTLFTGLVGARASMNGANIALGFLFTK